MRPYEIHAAHQQAREGNWPYGNKRLPGWVLDLIAEESVTGGYSNKKNPVCPECFVRKSNSGECNC